MLRVSKNSVYRLAQSGELASYRVGRKLRFTLRDVEAYTRSGIRSQKGAQTSNGPSPHPRTAKACPSPSGARERMSEIPRAFSLGDREPFVIAGNDLSGDIIAHALAAAGLPVSRAYVGSYTALVNLYAKRANAARAKGCADVAIGVERLAKELPGLAFVPLQTEWLDIAVEKSQRTAPLVREIRKIAESESFRSAIDAIEGYEATNTGAIVYES